MRRSMSCAGALLAAGMMVGPLGAAPDTHGATTAGDLALRLVRSAGVRVAGADPRAQALAHLATLGMALGADPDRPLVGGDLVAAGRALGVPIRTAAPAAGVTAAQASAFLGAVRGSLLRAEGNGQGNGGTKEGGVDASCQGRDSRSGREGTPASPADPNATAPPCTGGSHP